jgi:hypothetical protein
VCDTIIEIRSRKKNHKNNECVKKIAFEVGFGGLGLFGRMFMRQGKEPRNT